MFETIVMVVLQQWVTTKSLHSEHSKIKVRSSNIGLMLGKRRRRWFNIKSTCCLVLLNLSMEQSSSEWI